MIIKNEGCKTNRFNHKKLGSQNLIQFSQLFFATYNSLKMWDFGKFQNMGFRESKGVTAVVWVYVLENQGIEDLRSNQSVFRLINELGISDDYIVFDDDTARPELDWLLSELNAGDRLIVRSVEDMADTIEDLTDILQLLTDKQISLCSCEEDFLCGENYLATLADCIRLLSGLQRKRQQSAYAKAYNDGKVGRPKAKSIDRVISMYQSKAFSISQIAAVTGISKSTLYRHLEK